MPRVRLPLSPVLLLALLLAACGRPRLSSEVPSGAGSGPNWKQPIPGGVEVDSAEFAELGFNAQSPTGLGPPSRVVATATEYSPTALREIAWVYDESDFGRFFIKEAIVEGYATLLDWKQLASESPGCVVDTGPDIEATYGEGAYRTRCKLTTDEIVTLSDERLASVTSGNVTTGLHWLAPLTKGQAAAALEDAPYLIEPALEITILGPAEELSRSEAIEIAERMGTEPE